MSISAPLLEIENLSVHFATPGGYVLAVDEVSLRVQPARTLGVVGESGAGKSQTFYAVMGLLPRSARISGNIRFNGAELTSLRGRDLNAIRGARIAMIFQDPRGSLTPHLRIGEQLLEGIRAHERVSRSAAKARAESLLTEVGISDVRERLRAYPHQLSGGQCQRVMIAMAIACRPALIIADEPTTALDVTVQAQILDLLRKLQREHNTAIVIISHDLGVIAEMADEVAVMYSGQVVEQGGVHALLGTPRHPYTRGLLLATPRLDRKSMPLQSFPGQPLTGQEPQHGLTPTLKAPDWQECRFASRCPEVIEDCKRRRPLQVTISAGHTAACLRITS